jgi:hypothetical protein
MPTMILSFTGNTVAVLVSPLLGSPLTAVHFTSPVLASSATTVVSAWCRKIVSLA